MATPPVELPTLRRDGTSQAARVRAELDPDSIGPDERTLRDLLGFARAYATRLIYYDATNQPAGDWSGFFADLTDDQIQAFLDDPRRADDTRLRRPHFVLFLTLLRLLGTARDAMNGLTRRHLDHYFREILRLAPHPPEPDRAFVLFDLAAGVAGAEIPAGTRLAAGRDANRRERFYRTESGLVANRARVAKLSSVFADKRIIGLAEARTAPVGTKEDRFLAMLSLVLGQPLPGGSLPLYGGQSGQPVDWDKLESLATLARFAPTTLFLRQFELRQLVDRKQARDHSNGDWAAINGILQTAGRAKRNDPNWKFTPANPRDFNANLAAALNGAPDLSGLPEITTVEDLYVQRYRQDAIDAIKQRLFLSVDDFVKMMDLKRASDTDWRVVNSLLQLAGRRKRSDDSYTLKTADPSNFAANLAAALGAVNFDAVHVASIDAYAAAIVALEAYMHMPAETFAAMMATADLPEAQVPARTWRDIYATLEEAHRQSVFAARRDALRKTRETAASPAEGFRAILAQAAGETTGATADVLLADFTDLVSAAELATLNAIEDAPATASWAAAYDILERAWRKRERLPDPKPQREDWLNLYAYGDATTVRPSTGDTPRWKTFGAAPASESPDEPPPEIIGLAIASPLFALSAGERQITISFGFLDDGGGPLIAPGETAFAVQVSTAKGWAAPTSLEILSGANAEYTKLDGIAMIPAGVTLLGLRLRLTIAANAPPIAPLPGQDLAGCPWPAVRIVQHQIWDQVVGRWVIRYARLRTLRLARLHLRAATGGYVVLAPASDPVKPLLLENDSGPINGKRPFEPFGPQPAAGAVLWISHPDLPRKRLRSLRLLLEWMGGPSDLNAHYAMYQLPPGSLFSARLSLVDGTTVTAEGNPLPLFAGGAKPDATQPATLEIATVADSLAPYDPLQSASATTAREMPRVLRLELSPIGFGHQEYPALVTRKAIELAMAASNVAAKTPNAAFDPKGYAVNPPYTPKLKSFALEFVAGHEIRMEAYHAGPTTDMIFHIHPFGVAEARALADGFPFLPDYGNEGELLIGIAGLDPPETLSLLIQMAEGSANPDVAGQPVTWSVLDADGWRPVPGEAVLQDGTRGLINAGIVSFALSATDPDPRLPGGLYWLRAAVPSGAAAVCDIVAIHAQAAVARRELAPGASPEAVPLPPGTIKALAAPIPGVAAVRQPHAAFGGRQAEQASAFYTAASERLRHKDRPVTAWDYERLVLRRFPEVYKAKCLSQRLADAPAGVADSEVLGLVRLIVIPDIRGKSLFDPFEPKAASSLLADIADYLTPLLPGTARLRVENAAYVQIRIRVGVRFTDPDNPAFYRQKLNDELNRYLAPWAYDEGADIVIGRRIYASSIVTFIDQRPYVDYVAGIKLFSSDDGETFVQAPADPAEGDSIGSDRPEAVLVAARHHEIDLIADEIYAADQFKGVNYMKIELDFVVG